VWPRLHAALLTELRRAELLDLDDCAVDGSHVRALKGGTLSGRRRSTVPAPSTIWLSTKMEPREPLRSPARTDTTSSSSPRSSTLFRRSVACEDGLAASPCACVPTEATTSTSTDGCCERAASSRSLPDGASPTALGQARLAGCRACIRMAAPVQTAPRPLRTSRRPPPGPTGTGLQHHLPPTTPNDVLKQQRSSGEGFVRFRMGL
jgi:hypothetical protein